MKATIKATNPGEIEFTLSITATASQWVKLKDQLAADWPASDLRYSITQLIIQANQTFSTDEAPK